MKSGPYKYAKLNIFILHPFLASVCVLIPTQRNKKVPCLEMGVDLYPSLSQYAYMSVKTMPFTFVK